MGTITVLNRDDLTKRETSERDPGSSEGGSHEDVWDLGRSVSDWDMCLPTLGWGQVPVMSSEEPLGTGTGEEDIEVAVAGSMWPL